MDFSHDFVEIQGVLLAINKRIGDFTRIKYTGGNEVEINDISDGLKDLLSTKNYICDGRVNSFHEQALRSINLFLVLNTDFNNKSILTNDVRYSHLVGAIPKLSKCVLTNVIWNLYMYRFYAEAIFSLPIEISLELLENCNDHIKKAEPYAVLEQVAVVTLAIYVKLYHVRNEFVDSEKLQGYIRKYLKHFMDILQNYITPDMSQMMTWLENERYQYMGVAIYKILYLLKCCLNITVNECVSPLSDIFWQGNAPYCPIRLDRSGQALKHCNICLMSVCEANLKAISVVVFCSWAEFQHNNIAMQQSIGSVAYKVQKLLENFEEVGDLPDLLSAIVVEPQTIKDQIKKADLKEILLNVTKKEAYQNLWLKSLLKHGIFQSKKCFETFQDVINICDEHDWLRVLNDGTENIEKYPELPQIISVHIQNLEVPTLMETVLDYFKQNGVNNVYETQNFDHSINELFNKLNCDATLPLTNVLVFMLQNPRKTISKLLLESLKNINYLSSIVNIFTCLKPICLMSEASGLGILFDTLLNFVQNETIDQTMELCFIELIKELQNSGLLPKNALDIIFDMLDENIQNLHKSITLLKIIQVFSGLVHDSNGKKILEKVLIFNNTIRWNFFTYSEDKVDFITESVKLIKLYRHANPVANEFQTPVCSRMDLFHVKCDGSDNFLSFVSNGYNKNSSKNEKVCNLLKVFPFCIPSEWDLVMKELMLDLDPISVLNILCDMLLILSEISLKSCHDQKSLAYCFQNFCIVTKAFICPKINDEFQERIFVMKILKLIKHLPEINSTDILLTSLFNFKQMKKMTTDKEFMCILMSISHLDICKIISSKLAN